MAKVIYDYYSEEYNYSDDVVEDKLLKYYRNEIDETALDREGLLFFYHVSEVRKGLLYWYDFKPNSTVVEVGAGCGALTGLLCDKCKKVIAVELSKKRAEIIRLRNQDRENLEIYVANIHDLLGTIECDYVVCVGALEYQKKYTNTDNPYIDFLSRMKALLKDDGKLLLAIENRYGIKYWCGAPEDHTRIPYDGISDYRNGGKARTFTKSELEKLLELSGFTHRFFYYPMPDYRIVEEVYSDEYLPIGNWGLGITPYYGEYMDSLMTIEKTHYKDLFRNKVFDVFANSFLVEAGGTSDRYCNVVYAKPNFGRKKSFRVCTTIEEHSRVVKKPIDKQAEVRLDTCLHSAAKINALKSEYIEAVVVTKEDGQIVSPFLDYPCLMDKLLEAVEQDNYKGFEHLLDVYLRGVCESSAVVDKSSEYGMVMEELYIELTPSNCFIDDNEKLYVYDLEYSMENKPANFMIFRVIEYLRGLKKLFAWDFSFEAYIQKYNLKGVWEEYENLLKDYYKSVRSNNDAPLKNVQIIDIDRMELNSKFISGLGMKSLSEIERLNNEIDELTNKEKRRTEKIVQLYRKNESDIKDKFNQFVEKNIGNDEYELVLWGVGESFRRNVDLLKGLRSIRYACDSNPEKWNKTIIKGIECISFEELKSLEINPVILILVDDLRASFDVSMKIQTESDMRAFHITSLLHYLEA